MSRFPQPARSGGGKALGPNSDNRRAASAELKPRGSFVIRGFIVRGFNAKNAEPARGAFEAWERLPTTNRALLARSPSAHPVRRPTAGRESPRACLDRVALEQTSAAWRCRSVGPVHPVALRASG